MRLRRLKVNREELFDELCRVHGCICKESRKDRKSNDENGGDNKKKQDS